MKNSLEEASKKNVILLSDLEISVFRVDSTVGLDNIFAGGY